MTVIVFPVIVSTCDLVVLMSLVERCKITVTVSQVAGFDQLFKNSALLYCLHTTSTVVLNALR